MSFVSFALAVIFIISLFSTSAFRVPKLKYVDNKNQFKISIIFCVCEQMQNWGETSGIICLALCKEGCNPAVHLNEPPRYYRDCHD